MFSCLFQLLEAAFIPRGKGLACQPEDIRDSGLLPGFGKITGGEHGHTLQDSCLENPMDRGAWQATVHGVAKNRTGLKRLGTIVLITVASLE